MSSMFGNHLKLSIFGQSHGAAIGITLDGLPAGMALDMDAVKAEMARRAPGQSKLTTPRKEADELEILSGFFRGVTTGQPLCAIIRNTNQRSQDYGDGIDLVRPGHADYTGHVRYFGFEDFRGGGSFSGRLTAPIVFAGAVCKQYLQSQGVEIYAHIRSIAGEKDIPFSAFDGELSTLTGKQLPTLDAAAGEKMEQAILEALSQGDSVGGEIECIAKGVPAGLGAPFFDSVESVISHLLFSVPGVKAVSFGDGADFATKKGSEMNDSFRMNGGKIVTDTNHSGGINGGITNGMDVLFTATLRPTPSIALAQETVSVQKMENAMTAVRGRHDPCIVVRAVPVIEAVCAIALTELWKERASCLH